MHRHLRVGGTLEPELQAVASIPLLYIHVVSRRSDSNKGGSSSALNEGLRGEGKGIEHWDDAVKPDAMACFTRGLLLERILVTFFQQQ